jgi:hypothetical protein
VNTGPAGYGGNGAGPDRGFGWKFPNGGAGGYYGGGGGGSGFSGGGGRGNSPGPGAGGGGGSYLGSLFKDQVLTSGVNSGNGV